jgi:bis(5'-nucleosyl)-tetraphosphatase (symmetrical)
VADYFVGDVQGCLSELQALLEQVSFEPTNDKLYLAGDLVARGPQSLATLRFVKSLGKSAQTVLGNHDLHLLAINAGIKRAKKSDHLTAILTAPDKIELIEWLAHQPLLVKLPNENAYLSHAGVSPQWTIDEAIAHAKYAENKLQSSERHTWLASMYGEQPNNWQDVNNDTDKFRFIINTYTRMRFCYRDNSLEFSHKDAPTKITSDLKPWYELSTIVKNNYWIFGHWASLMGQCSQRNIFALDTGCVWGHYLTLLRWHDKKLFTEPAHLSNK